MQSDPVQCAEILNWWSEQRGKLDATCRIVAKRIADDAEQEIARLKMRDLVLPSGNRRKLETGVRARIANSALDAQKQLQLSLCDSLRSVEGIDPFSGVAKEESAVLAAGGLAGAGALGLAVMATGLASTTGPAVTILGVLSFGTLSTFSWPAFTIAAIGAGTLAAVSPKIIGQSREMLRRRYIRYIRDMVEKQIITGTDRHVSILASLLAALDDVRDHRMKGIEDAR